jgi:hypothetical protein
MKPTYLYIKQHSVTCKFYFGKTTSRDPIKYLGSGLHWVPHIKKHGREYVVTLWYELFTDQEELTTFALEFSEKMDIVKSDQWLNMIPENGIGGQSTENVLKWHKAMWSSPNHNSKDPEHLRKMQLLAWSSPNHVSKHVELARKGGKASAALPNHNFKDPEFLMKMRKLAWQSPNHVSRQLLSCPHCGKDGKGASMYRWHFDNCRKKEHEKTLG